MLQIERLRKAKGWSQMQLAAEAGMSQTAVSTYELGAKKPGMAAIVALCKALGCTADELLGIDQVNAS